MTTRFPALLLGLLAWLPVQANAQNGEVLYGTHCVACHTTEMHWRQNRVATDWNSLGVQVRRWQAVSGLGWSEDDILDVTRYLNDSIYHFPPQSGQRTVASPDAAKITSP